MCYSLTLICYSRRTEHSTPNPQYPTSRNYTLYIIIILYDYSHCPTASTRKNKTNNPQFLISHPHNILNIHHMASYGDNKTHSPKLTPKCILFHHQTTLLSLFHHFLIIIKNNSNPITISFIFNRHGYTCHRC